MISAQWISRQEALLAATAKDSPHREALVSEIAEAKAQLAAQLAQVAVLAKAGFRRNQYPGKSVVSGQPVKALAGFVRRNATGRWETYSWDEAVEAAS